MHAYLRMDESFKTWMHECSHWWGAYYSHLFTKVHFNWVVNLGAWTFRKFAISPLRLDGSYVKQLQQAFNQKHGLHEAFFILEFKLRAPNKSNSRVWCFHFTSLPNLKHKLLRAQPNFKLLILWVSVKWVILKGRYQVGNGCINEEILSFMGGFKS